jgi:hypothetical protein
LSDVFVDAVSGDDGNAGDTPATAKKSIQAGIDAVCVGGTVHVYPGSYSEAASGRFVLGVNGPHQFGLFVDKDNVTIQGVDAGGTPITDFNSVLAEVETNATNNFGFSGVFVQADGVTITGLKILPNVAGDNKTFEIIGDGFVLGHCDITTGWSVYFNDWQYDDGGTSGDDSDDTSHLQSYTVEANVFRNGGSIDLASGAGFSGPASGRIIRNNVFEEDVSGQDWPFVSFNGSETGVPWFVYSVGGAVIEGNDFSNSYNVVSITAAHIRSRGTVDVSQFDWESYWDDNTFNKAVVALSGAPFEVRTYSYPHGFGTFNDVRRIGLTIQGEVNNAVAGDKVLVNEGTYEESPAVNKSLTVESDDGRDVTFIELQSGPTYLGAFEARGAGSIITVDGFTIIGFDAAGAGLASTNIAVVNALSNTPAEVLIKNNRIQVGGIGVGSNGDDGMGLITYYSETFDVGKVTVENNIFEPVNSEASRAFFVNPGVDKFTFRGNEISGKFNGTALTQAKDGLVEENTVTGTGSAGSRSAGLGTWGYPTPSVYGKTNFRNNEISGTRGISIFETENVTVENNELSSNDRGVRVLTAIPLAFDATTIHITENSITGSDVFAVEKDAAVSGILDAVKNWWGSDTGPTHASNAAGTGDPVSDDVDFDPWLCDGTDTSGDIGFQPNVSSSPCPQAPAFLFLASKDINLSKHHLVEGDLFANGKINYKPGNNPSTHNGNATAVGKIKIQAGNTIDGDVTSGSTVSNSGDVLGVISENDPLSPMPLPNLLFSAGGDNQTAPKNGTLALAPGTYGNVKALKNATLQLSGGEYFMQTLMLDQTSKLTLDVASEAITINVVGLLSFGKNSEVEISPGGDGATLDAFFNSLGPQLKILEGSRVLGSIVAPNATVAVQKGASLKGSIVGKVINVNQNATVLPHGSGTVLPKLSPAEYIADDVEAEETVALPTEFALNQNYPNPFNPTTTIGFAVPDAGEVKLAIYNLRGQLVRILHNGPLAAGHHKVVWDGADAQGAKVATGVYVYRLEGNNFIAHRKLVLAK